MSFFKLTKNITCLQNHIVSLWVFAVSLIFVVLSSCANTEIKENNKNESKKIEVINSHIECRNGILSICITIRNQSFVDSIKIVDLYLNQNNKDSSRIILEPEKCDIAPNDTCNLKFFLGTVRTYEEYLNGITSKYIAVRYDNGKSARFTQSSTIDLFSEYVSFNDEKIQLDNYLKELGKINNYDEEVEEVIPSEIYRTTPNHLYESTPFFTSLTKVRNGKQVAKKHFFGYVPYVFKQKDNKYMIAFNSLSTPIGVNKSSYTAKTILLDSNLNVLKEREFRYKEQKDAYYAFVYIDTMIQKKDGYDFKVINTGFDPADYYEYQGHLSFSNVVTKSTKKNVVIEH